MKRIRNIFLLLLCSITAFGSSAFLAENKVQSFDATYSDNTQVFADGEQIKIDGEFTKIISEGIDITTTLLKTARIKQDVYLKNPQNESTIRVPGIATGVVEAAVKSVTDITEPIIMVYDLAVDKQARTDAYNGLKQIKEEIGNDYTLLFSMLKEIASEEFTGNTPEEWAEINNEQSDRGRTVHLVSKGSVQTALTAVVSGKFIAQLPMIATDVGKKIIRHKLLKVVTRGVSFDDFKNATKWQMDKVAELEKDGQKFIEELWGAFIVQDLDGIQDIYRRFGLDPGEIYPPNNGAWNVNKITLKEEDIIDRYGSPTGTFASPAGTRLEQRSLSASQRSLTPQKYKIIREISVEEGQIIPWFGEEGLGIQYKFEKNINDLLNEGYIIIID